MFLIYSIFKRCLFLTLFHVIYVLYLHGITLKKNVIYNFNNTKNKFFYIGLARERHNQSYQFSY